MALVHRPTEVVIFGELKRNSGFVSAVTLGHDALELFSLYFRVIIARVARGP